MVLETERVVYCRAQGLYCRGQTSQTIGNCIVYKAARCFHLLVKGLADCAYNYIFKDFLLLSYTHFMHPNL